MGAIRKLRHGCAFGMLFGGVVAIAAGLPVSVSAQSSQSVRLGAYDPYRTFSNDTRVTIEHVYITWEDIDLASLDAADKYALQRDRDILLTIEPWSWSQKSNRPAAELLKGIMAGKFDGIVTAACSKSAGLKSKVTIRWGHEMDIANKRYPWSRWSAPDYIAAYRHFVDICRKHAPNVTFMWSPRGEDNNNDYYPGDAYVDSVGISVFGLQKFDLDEYGKERSFEELTRRAYDLVEPLKKPVHIAEFGCRGDEHYMLRCWPDLKKAAGTFPNLKSVVYFNEVETYPWPAPYGYPDWRVYEQFLKKTSP